MRMLGSRRSARPAAWQSGLRARSSGAGLLIAAFALPLLIAACGGGKKLTFDPAKADTLAHAALISESDLPGSGWKVTETDQFSDGTPFTSDTSSAACKSLDQAFSSVKSQSEAGRAGRAEKAFEQQGGLIPTIVQVQVTIFKDTKVPSSALDTFKQALNGNDFTSCLTDTMKQGFGKDAPSAGNLNLSVNPGTAAASAPLSGVAKAFDVSLAATGLSVNMHLEAYLWRDGNAGITVFLFGSKDALTSSLVKTVVDKMQAGLDRAAKQ